MDDEDADFITCIENEELHEIISTIEQFDFEKVANNFDPIILKRHKVYPNRIWEDGKQQLIDEFKLALTDILNFYKKALETKHHIIVSIL